MAVSPHDILINSVGYMVDRRQGGPVTVQGLNPGTARAADGEADYVRFEHEAGHQITDFSGGMGQQRHTNSQRFLTGIGDGVSGHYFPPKLKRDESDGGTETWFFRRGGTLYGKTSTAIEEIGTATTFSATGTPDSEPTVSANNDVYYTSGNSIYKWSGSGSATDISISGFEFKGARVYGRHLFAWAKRTLPGLGGSRTSSSVVRQNVYASSNEGETVVGSWSESTIPGNTLLAAIVVGHDNSNTYGITPNDAEWNSLRKETSFDDTDNRRLTMEVFSIPDSNSFRNGAESFTVEAGSGSEDPELVQLYLVEIDGSRTQAYGGALHDSESDKSLQTTTISTGTATADTTNGIAFSLMAYVDNADNSETISHDTGWTEEDEQAEDDGSVFLRSAIATENSPDASESDSDTITTRSASAGIIITMFGFDEDTEQDVILASATDGETWQLAPGNYTAQAIGTPRAFAAHDGFLYFTTQYGLYRMRYGEDEYLSGTQVVNLAIEQVGDFRGYPTSDNSGKWLEIYQNGLFMGVGDAVLRWTRGGGLEAIWPTPDWATVGGQIQAIVSAGSVLFWGAGGYLWKFNGRAFFAVATEPISNAFDYMFFHDGKLYLKANPADYFDFGNPSLRPDIFDATAANVDTGYWISSRLDFRKVNILKLISEFEEQVKFTAATSSGSVAWHYIKACSDDPDPGRYGGGATSLTWTSIGTHNQGDSSPKTTDISPPIECKALYLRATLSPGANGFPYLVYVAPIGRAMPPVQRRFTVPIILRVGERDKDGTEIYSSESDIATAISNLQALRDPGTSPNAFTMIWDDESAAGESVTVSMTDLAIQKHPDRQADGSYYIAVVTMDELP